MRVVVAASPNDLAFAVINFTVPGSPSVVSVNAGFGGPCVLDADGDKVAAGSLNGDDVTLFDISVPATPVALGSIATGLVGIGCISLDGNRVLVGEANGLRAALIDFATPSAPKVLSKVTTGLSSLGSVALAGNRAIAAGPNDTTIRIIDYSSPATPAVSTFNPAIGGPLVADLDGTRAVVGDQTGSIVKLIDLSVPSVIGTANTTLSGISGVSLAGSLVAASSTNDTRVALVSFASPSSPSVNAFNAGLGGGVSASVGAELVAGAVLGTTVKLFGLSGTTATLLGTANSGVSSIASIALSDFTPSAPPPIPNIVVTPAVVPFSNVAVCQSATKPVTIKNTGNGALSITGISTNAPFSVTPSSPATVSPNGTLILQVKFTPTATGSVNGVLRISSNDPDTPVTQLPLQGTGTPTPPPEIAVAPTSLNFGASIPKYFFGLRVRVTNKSPCTALTLTGLSTGNAVFPITSDPAPSTIPATTSLGAVTIPPALSRVFVVVFAPPSTGPFNGTLTITSTDPVRPTITVPLSGVGVLPKPTAACLVLDRGPFLAFGAGWDANVAALHAAILLFLDLMPEEQGDYLGSVTSTIKGAIPLTHILPVDAAVKNSIRLKLPFIVPGGGALNVGWMLNLAWIELTGELDDLRAKMVNPPPPPERRVIIAFTGGRELKPPFIKDVTPVIVNDGIEVYAVSVGSGTAIDAAALTQLAASSKGKFFVSEDLLLLRKNFVQVLADAFRMNMAADPIASVARGATHDVRMRLTKCERRLRFVCSWHDFDEQLGVQLIAPDGTVFTPASPATNPLVRFVAKPGSAFYDLMLPPIDDNDVIGPQVVGTWIMRISGRQLQRDEERFTTSLLVESDAQLKLRIRDALIGATARLHINLLHDGGPLAGADVRVTVESPLVSAQEVRIRELAALAERATRELPADADPAHANQASAVRPADSAETHPDDDALRALIDDRLTPSERAMVAVPSLPIPYRSRVRRALPTRNFEYSVPMPRFVRDGIHHVTVEVRAPACGGILTRYLRFAVAPLQRLDIDSSRFQLVREPGPGEPVTINFTPRDAAGNLLGVGLKSRMNLVPTDGTTVLRVIDRFDGSYSIQLATRERAAVKMAIELNGQVAVAHIPISGAQSY